jgi:ATPase subunit of ABC transporter with duplicated ATPase domains
VIFELIDGRVEIGAEKVLLLEHAELWLERGEHVSLVGPNGSGKTTLIETLTAQRPLAAGKLRTGHNVTVGYLSQHGDELGNSGTVLAATQRATGLTPNKARALLGRFLFSGELAEKPLAGCSGGERRRLSLAILVTGGANVLILDEPTNHLNYSIAPTVSGWLRTLCTAEGPYWNRTGSFGPDAGRLAPALISAGFGANVVTSKGSDVTPINLDTPEVSAPFPAPWNA